jgi:hypothetical protein
MSRNLEWIKELSAADEALKKYNEGVDARQQVGLAHLWRAARFIPAVKRPGKRRRSTGINPVARCVNLGGVEYNGISQEEDH